MAPLDSVALRGVVVESQSRTPAVINSTVWIGVAANVAAVAAVFGYTWYTFGHMADHYPVHYSPRGPADSWVIGADTGWYYIPAVAAAMALLLIVFALLLPRIPLKRWHLPNKERLLQAPWPQQLVLIRAAVMLVLTISVLDTALFFAVQVAFFRVVSDQMESDGTIWVLALAVLYPVIIIPWVTHLNRRVAGMTAAP